MIQTENAMKYAYIYQDRIELGYNR